MKKALKMVNTLDKCEHTTLQEKVIKQAGIDAMLKLMKEIYGQESYTYKPGKGFIENSPK